jgi:hypothetical protein
MEAAMSGQRNQYPTFWHWVGNSIIEMADQRRKARESGMISALDPAIRKDIGWPDVRSC